MALGAGKVPSVESLLMHEANDCCVNHWKYNAAMAEEIFKEKCLIAARQIDGSVLVEDTWLCFNALKGLLGLNTMLSGFEDKTAYALCVFSYRSALKASPSHSPAELRYAEMPKEEKSKISHRGRALELVRQHLEGAKPSTQ
eukprot:jgi/Chlat1/1323/Chrsp118S01749